MRVPFLRLSAVLALVAALSWPALSFADKPPAPPAEEEAAPKKGGSSGQGSTTFDDGGREAQGLNLMVAAYIAVWVLLLVYLLTIFARQRRLASELEELHGRLAKLDESVVNASDAS